MRFAHGVFRDLELQPLPRSSLYLPELPLARGHLLYPPVPLGTHLSTLIPFVLRFHRLSRQPGQHLHHTHASLLVGTLVWAGATGNKCLLAEQTEGDLRPLWAQAASLRSATAVARRPLPSRWAPQADAQHQSRRPPTAENAGQTPQMVPLSHALWNCGEKLVPLPPSPHPAGGITAQFSPKPPFASIFKNLSLSYSLSSAERFRSSWARRGSSMALRRSHCWATVTTIGGRARGGGGGGVTGQQAHGQGTGGDAKDAG